MFHRLGIVQASSSSDHWGERKQMARGLLGAFLVVLCLPVLSLAGESRSQTGPARVERTAAVRYHLPSDAEEVVAHRGERTKRFHIPGTSRFAEVATGRVMHYRDTEGELRDTEAVLRPVGLDAVADSLPFGVRVTSEGLLVGTRDGNAGVLFLTEDRPSASGERISTRVTGQTLDWYWDVSRTELKPPSGRAPTPIRRRRG